MSVNINSGFNVNSESPIDSRFIRSKNQMKSTDDANMPATYFCVCSDDKKFYVYDKSATNLDPETGKFKALKTEKPSIYFVATPEPDPDILKSAVPGSIFVNYFIAMLVPERCTYASWDKIGDVPRVQGPIVTQILLSETVESTNLCPLCNTASVTINDEVFMNAVLQTSTAKWFNPVIEIDAKNIKSAYIAYHVEDDGSVTKTIEATLTNPGASHCPDEDLIACTPLESRTEGANPWIVNYH